MLLNNFKSLLTWNTTDTFIDTSGTEVAKTEFLVGSTSNVVNSHVSVGTLSYNYTTTTAVSSYTDEQTAYHYNGIVQTLTSNTLSEYNEHNGLILFVGTGTTTPTKDDYKLESAVAFASPFGSCTHNSNVTSVVRTFTNDTEEDVTITEIGLYVFHSLCACNSNYSSYPVLVGRKILDAPVTIEPNETYTFTYNVIMDGFTFTEG